LILRRATFIREAEAIFQAQDQGRLEAYVSAITPSTVYYITRRATGSVAARQAIADLLTAARVCAVTHSVLQNAVGLPLADYEDAIQLAGALAERLDAIVTRDPHDFKGSPIPVFSPAALLARM
jgi:predicted nucleic acid-binding protein